jgi:hypothetical protein
VRPCPRLVQGVIRLGPQAVAAIVPAGIDEAAVSLDLSAAASAVLEHDGRSGAFEFVVDAGAIGRCGEEHGWILARGGCANYSGVQVSVGVDIPPPSR